MVLAIRAPFRLVKPDFLPRAAPRPRAGAATRVLDSSPPDWLPDTRRCGPGHGGRGSTPRCAALNKHEHPMPTDKQSFLAELQARLVDLVRTSPAADVERNVKALLAQAFQKLELVTRDEFDTGMDLLANLTRRVESLEHTLAAQAGERDTGTTPPSAGHAG